MNKEERQEERDLFARMRALLLELRNQATAREGGAEPEGQGGPDHGADQ